MRKTGFKLSALVTIFFLLLLALFPAAGYAVGSDWPQFHNTVDNNGYSTSSAPATGNLLRWSANASVDPSSSPVIAGGKVYVYSCPTNSNGDVTSSAIVCLDEVTGSTLWSTPVDTAQWGSWSSPAYDDGLVFIGSGEKLFCLDATSGKIDWSSQLHLQVVNSSPRVAGGAVFITDWDGAGGGACYLYSFKESTGSENWEFPMHGSYSEATPAYDNGMVFASSWDSDSSGPTSGNDNTYCVNAATGAQVWHQTGLEEITCAGSPTVAAGKVFVATYDFYGDAELAALDESSGAILWVATDQGMDTGLNVVAAAVPVERTDATPAYYNGDIYLSGGCPGYSDQYTYCFNADTGSELWTQGGPGKELGSWTCSPAVADGMVFVGQGASGGTMYNGYSGLYALDASTGAILWSGAGGSSPAVADGWVFTCAGGVVYAYGALAVTGISLNKTTDTIDVGQTDSLTATIAPGDATDQNVTWTSSDSSVATVVYSGTSCTLKGVAPGTTTITATTEDGGFSAACAVTVQNSGVVHVTGVSLDKTGVVLQCGSSTTLSATLAPSGATNQAVTWVSDNPAVATVVYSGTNCTVTAAASLLQSISGQMEAGELAHVTATTADGGFMASCTVAVTDLPNSYLTTTAPGVGTDAIADGDFNGDGRIDLVTASGSNASACSVSVLPGNGDGSFQLPAAPAALGYGAQPVAIAVGDFNGDGKLDVATANQGGNSVSVLLGNGDGSFQAPVNYLVGSDPMYIVAGDFNGDGKIDLAVGNQVGKSVSVLLGNGDGSFQPAVSYPVSGPVLSLLAGDFNGDGRLDLAVATSSTTPNDYRTWVSVLLGNGDGSFQAPIKQVISQTDAGEVRLLAGDFTSNGRLDLAVGNTNNTLTIWLGNGDGAFQQGATFSGVAQVAGDFTGDGRLDLAGISGAGAINVWLGNGDGSFQAPVTVTYPASAPIPGLVAGDFTGDGKLGLAVTNSENTVYILSNSALAPTVPVTGISLSKTTDSLTVDGTDTLSAKVSPDDATNQSLTWTSSKSSVATVVYDTATGAATVTAVAPGTATITAAASDGSDISATCQVTVAASSGGSTGDIYDVNADGAVNVLDLLDVYQHFTSQAGAGDSYDVNADGAVNVLDLLDVYQHFTS